MTVIKIQKDSVIADGKIVGTMSKFCCGIDLRLKDRPKALFSILGVNSFSDSKLKACVKGLLSIQIPENKSFHWNFRYDMAKNEDSLRAYEMRLNQKAE